MTDPTTLSLQLAAAGRVARHVHDAADVHGGTTGAHTHVEGDVTSLVTDLSGKQAHSTKLDAVVALADAVGSLTNDGAGGLSWAASLQARTTAAVTSSSLAANASQQTTVTIAKGFRLLHIQTDVAARVRLYSTAAGQAADASRLVGNDPAMGVGVILDYVTTSSAKNEDLSPLADGASMEATPSTSIPITITNLSGSTSTVTATLTYIRTE